MVLHPQDKVLEIEDFHVKYVQQDEEASDLLKRELLEYLEKLETQVLRCPHVLRRLMKIC
ncbi:MAG: hypothetical protein OEZ24_04725 [Candidatus Bathyarchaeota archaeon]|nr:hypothetical protein [Candidatus Bathyarchaeota archaeon]